MWCSSIQALVARTDEELCCVSGNWDNVNTAIKGVLNMCCKFASREVTSVKIIRGGWNIKPNHITSTIAYEFVPSRPVSSRHITSSDCLHVTVAAAVISLLCFPHIHSAGVIRPYHHYPLSVHFSNSRGGTTLQSPHTHSHTSCTALLIWRQWVMVKILCCLCITNTWQSKDD